MRYGIAVLSVILLRVIETAIPLPAGSTYLLALFPIVASTWFGGFGPGLLATALGVLATGWDSGALSPVVFAGVGVAISLLAIGRERARAALWEAGKQSAEELRRWEYIFENAGWGIVVLDAARLSMRNVNPAYARMHGYTQEELMGRPLVDTLSPESRTRLEKNMAIADENGHYVYESLHLRKDGTTFPALIDFTVLKDGKGKVLLHTAYTQDITDRKQLEQRVRESMKRESLSVLAGGMAHDFNNLLVSIIGNASLLIEDQPPGSPARESLSDILRASEKAADLTRQMLAYSGQGRFLIQPVNLSSEVRESSDLLRASIPANVRLEFDLSGQTLPVEADPGQIRQLILNLVVNGAEAIGDKPGVVRIGTRVETIDEHTGLPNLKAGTYVCLEVTDTGSGMDGSTVTRIFDPFFTTKFTGRGLGLAAVSGIVRSHGGSIDVQSKLGDGSTFRVFLPVAETRMEMKPAA
jgi:PAS domain S-box-containing protein